MSLTIDFEHIIRQFQVEGRFLEAIPITRGHINASFRISLQAETTQSWFLQRVNPQVFPDIKGLMENIDMITSHLERKPAGDPNVLPSLLKLVKTNDGKLFFTDLDGAPWRMFNYLENTHSLDQVTEVNHAREGGAAFGKFLLSLSDFDAKRLNITLPRFHDLEYRVEQYQEACDQDRAGRVKDVFSEIRIVKEILPDMFKFWQIISKCHVPVRITHNDTKFNNVLLNPQGKAVCIVDLDTVMPGSMLFDFGDAIRTLSNTAAEDESDLKNVDFNRKLYKAFTEAYLDSCRSVLTRIEMIHMPYAALYMTFLIGLRFLTDHINGDIYYRINRENHNLDRARVQFRLMSCMQQNFDFMKQN
jgi:Ser/Thr protein kinase RdoA (MazF antagonist)